MQFRQFLILGLMAGAAFLLPDNAFAEKNNVNQPQAVSQAVEKQGNSSNVNQASSQAGTPLKAESAKTKELPAAAAEKGSPSNQAAKLLPSQAASSNSASKEDKKQLPVQANEHAQSNNGQGEKATTETSNAAVKDGGIVEEDQQMGADLDSNLSPPKGETEKTPVRSKSAGGAPIHVEPKVAAQGETQSPQPLNDERRPADSGKLPNDDQATNSNQRTNAAGSSPNERVSGNTGIHSLVDKWFEWDRQYETELFLFYYSRQEWLTNQWVNAPPSPPPQ
ncbi:hypothetical protein [Neobacillus sp. Marseille-QA0830]